MAEDILHGYDCIMISKDIVDPDAKQYDAEYRERGFTVYADGD